MVNTLGLLLGLGMALTLVGLHFLKGTANPAPEDIASEVLEQRASTVPDTDFPEPYNRSIGGGGGAGAVAGGGAEGELEEESEEDEGFDPESIPDDEVEYYEIEFVKQGETIEVANNENLLEAGEDEGWDLPYACRQGQCLSCGGRVADGSDSAEFVRHSNNETLSDDEMEKGYMLTCTAHPTSSFSLETDETP
ncbi:2Fe-2S iron-sulfur cluster-binding protein [Halobacterium sp. R2-5]|uniref:2Fe-2S iron-sulfur cluster-binding protein n=1 Tax=Halobacterium sp. R2-5 TaxID=2715751 RepID=UPI001420385A|nr:2Fe-2S iron-sulfur cluster-binding protein [Halobacterium sp. R2-5]NIB98356.1 2Fe-2S iron-sulfur cluster binding domain-containing protein [Halobacterium sp. R2-5]